MPRAKPVAAGAQHLTKAEKEERLEREKAIRLGTDGIYPPAWLGGHFHFPAHCSRRRKDWTIRQSG